MSGEQQIWAARCEVGRLCLFLGEPGRITRSSVRCVGEIDPDLLPSLKPGEKCRVKIARAE